jgi:hypothetical protein
MGSIRKILVIKFVVLTIAFLTSVSFAGMGGGGHHMSGSDGHMNFNQGFSTPNTERESKQFDQNSNMHEGARKYNMNGHRTIDGMPQNNFMQKGHGFNNDNREAENGMDYQQQGNYMDMGSR